MKYENLIIKLKKKERDEKINGDNGGKLKIN